MENTPHLNLSGFPGAGKTTITKKLIEKYSTVLIPKFTTRPRRATENKGEYVFISKKTFKSRNENGHFIAVEPNIVNGILHYHAIPKTLFWPKIPNTADLVLSVFGVYARDVKKYAPEMKLCFVTFKNMDILRERLRIRCLADRSNFQEKMKVVEEYLKSDIQSQYDHIIYNDGSIEETLEQIITLIKNGR